MRPAGYSGSKAESRPEEGGTLIDWTVKYAVPLVGIVGAVLFAVLRLAYFFFYMPLRATPQEVGYGYSEILSGQLLGTAELVILLTAIMLAVTVAAGRVRHALAGRWRAVVSLPQREPTVRLGQRCGLLAMAVVLAGLPMLAWLCSTEAQHGYTVRNIYLLHTVKIPVLAVQASPATAAWTTAAPPGTPDLSRRHCLLYLGQAAGTTVFYDVRTRESLHVPSAQILLTLPNITSIARTCS